MKGSLPLFDPWLRATYVLFVAVGLFGMSSCEKITELSEKVGDLVKSDEGPEKFASVVGEEEGKKIISEESRIVLLEFYSDT